MENFGRIIVESDDPLSFLQGRRCVELVEASEYFGGLTSGEKSKENQEAHHGRCT